MLRACVRTGGPVGVCMFKAFPFDCTIAYVVVEYRKQKPGWLHPPELHRSPWQHSEHSITSASRFCSIVCDWFRISLSSVCRLDLVPLHCWKIVSLWLNLLNCLTADNADKRADTSYINLPSFLFPVVLYACTNFSPLFLIDIFIFSRIRQYAAWSVLFRCINVMLRFLSEYLYSSETTIKCYRNWPARLYSRHYNVLLQRDLSTFQLGTPETKYKTMFLQGIKEN